MIATLIFFAASMSSPQAGDERGSSLAVRGLDPVFLCHGEEVPGSANLEARHGRYAYRFVTEESRARFHEDPERWCIQWGGGCGRMGPLSGVGSPDRWAVHAERIYVFASDGCREGFLAEPERFVPRRPSHPPIDEAARKKGGEWIARAVEAHGGAAVIDSHEALRLVFEGPRSGWDHRLEQVISRGGELMRRSVWTPPPPDSGDGGEGGGGFDTVWVLADDAFVDEGQPVFPITSSDQVADLRRYAYREPIAFLWARDGDDFLALHVGQGALGGEPVENVFVLQDGLATTLHLDPPTGLIRGVSWRGRPSDGVTRDVVETFTNWEEIDGVLLPGDRTVTADGEQKPAMAVAWTDIELLPEPPPGAFSRATYADSETPIR